MRRLIRLDRLADLRLGAGRAQRGLMMLEAVAAVAVTATAGAASLVLISIASTSTAAGSAESTASWLATSQAEKIHAAPYVATPGQYESILTPTGFVVTNATSDITGGGPGIQLVTISVTAQGKEVMNVEFVKVDR